MGPTEICTAILLPKPPQNLPVVPLLEPRIPDCTLRWVYSKLNLFLMQGTAWMTTHLTIPRARFQLSDVQVSRKWHHLRIWALLSLIRGLAIAVPPWMVNFLSSRQIVFVETGSSIWIFGSATVHVCYSISVIVRINLSQCMTISFCQCWFSSTVPLRWCPLPMIRVRLHNLRNRRSRCT
jgi:hypothetical protein